jgi:hypothetical protein
MKLRELKKFVNSLTEDQLDKPVIYNSKRYSLSGVIEMIKKAPGNLYNTGEDDPAELYTRKQLKEHGYDNEEIEEMDIEIQKGDIVIEF